MNKKNKTIDCYFKKIESRKSGSNLKVGDKDEGNQNSLMDASLGTYTSDDKEDDASERSDDDSLHQSSQFLEIIENSFSHLGTVPPENVQSSLSQTTFPERNLFNNGENATSSKMDYSFSQSFSTSKGRSFKDTTNKDICDRNTTNKLMHFSEHIVLINTKVSHFRILYFYICFLFELCYRNRLLLQRYYLHFKRNNSLDSTIKTE